MWEARALEVAEFEGKRTSQAAPYLGDLALLHTSKMVYWESYNAMRDLVSCHRAARFGIMAKAYVPMSKAIWGQDSQLARLLRYEHDETEAIWAYMTMISKSFSNTYPRHLSDYLAVTFHGNLHGRASKSAQSTTDADENTDSEAGIAWDATLTAAVKYFPNIYASIQRRLEGGDGVRTSFKAEVKLRADWEITNDEVAIMIKGVAALGASLKTIRGPDCDNRLRQFKVVKRKSRPKRYRSKTSCDLPMTWLSSDEMDTGP